LVSKLGNKNAMEGKRKNTMVLSFKVLLPHNLYPFLEELNSKVKSTIELMLKNREKSSSKYYKDVPCVVAKSLITKYQRNKKCKRVSKPVIPVCGDKGKQVKLEHDKDGNPFGIRVPALFKKQVLSVRFPKPISGHIRNIEIFRRKKKWYLTYQYDTPCQSETETQNIIGIDRNYKGNVATLANPQNGQVLRLGPSIKDIKQNFRNRKAKIARKGKKRLLKKLSKKQLNRTKDVNHKVSRQIVDYAQKHSSAIVVEELKVKGSKIDRKIQRDQWSYGQLQSFITYKAGLCGVSIHYVSPKNTSKECSRCGTINLPRSKTYKCFNCGHNDHRDANAAFNIAKRYGQTSSNQKLKVGLNGNP